MSFKKIFSAIILVFAVFVMDRVYCFDEDNQTTDNPLLEEAKKLYLNGDIAQAAISFYEVQNQSYVTPVQRSIAQEQFNSCVELLRSNPEQTERFGDIVALQKEDFKIQFLLQTYASILEFQGKVDASLSVYRRIYNRWPGASQKYMLGRKLEHYGMYAEAFELYQDLLNDPRYRIIVLRQILEGAQYSSENTKSVDEIIKTYYNDIIYNYDLINILVSVYVSQNRYREALELACEMVSRYPNTVDFVVNKFAPLYKEGKLDKDLIDSVLSVKNGEDQKFLFVKILAVSGDMDTALSELNGLSSPKALEYKADLLFSSAMLNQAKEIYLQLIKKQPQDSLWFYRLAEISLKTGDKESAVQYFKTYLGFSENMNFNTYFQVGKVLEQSGMNELAKSFYAGGKKFASENTYAQIELIRYYIGDKNYKLAAMEIVESQKQPRMSTSNLILTMKYMLASGSEFELLTDELISAIRVEEKSNGSNEELSNLFYCAHVFANEAYKTDFAVEFFKKYYSLMSANPESDIRLMEFVKKLETANCPDKINEVLSLVPPNSQYYPRALHKRAQILLDKGDASGCLEILKSDMSVKDDLLKAQALFKIGQLDQAYKLLTSFPVHVSAVQLLKGDIALSRKQYDLAIQNYAKIGNSSDELYMVARYRTGMAFLFEQKFKEAQSVFDKLADSNLYSKEAGDAIKIRKIMALMTQNKDILRKWSESEFSVFKGDYSYAVKQYKELIEATGIAVYSPDLRIRLYEIYLMSGNKQLALVQLDEITALFPDSSFASEAMRYSIALQAELNAGFNKEQAYIKLLEKYPDSIDADIVRGELEKMKSDKITEKQM